MHRWRHRFCQRYMPKLLPYPRAHPGCFRRIMTGHGRSRQPRPDKRPALTHFLCLPLINSASIPQLEKSLSAFKNTHRLPLGPHAGHDPANPTRLGLPDTAFRPLGTLHLTLGVMSLTTQRLEQATEFLQSLDLESLMHEAERVASRSSPRSQTHSSHAPQTSTSVVPFSVSLESLHALPQAASATILHASPVDPTDRLYPFCVMLRDKFIEAGFMLNEAEPKKQMPSSQSVTSNASQSAQAISPSRDASSHAHVLPKTLDPYTVAMTREPKPRPLLLHATLVNTIYVRGRKNYADKSTPGKGVSKRFTFDASNLVSQPTGHTLPPPAGSVQPIPINRHIWARDIPLDDICICEMGAKKLQPGSEDQHGLNARMGEKYVVVAQRSIVPTR